jgi:hypothetical protein
MDTIPNRFAKKAAAIMAAAKIKIFITLYMRSSLYAAEIPAGLMPKRLSVKIS